MSPIAITSVVVAAIGIAAGCRLVTVPEIARTVMHSLFAVGLLLPVGAASPYACM